MNKRIKNNIKKAFDEISPDIFDSIKDKEAAKIENEAELFCALIDAKKNEEQDTNSLTQKMLNRKVMYILAAPICALVLVCIFVASVLYGKKAVYDTIILDVNPSIEYNLNRKGEVINVKAVNNDGKDIVEQLTKKGSLENILYDTLVQLDGKGYFQYDDNEVLLTYCFKKKQGNVSVRLNTAVESFNRDREKELVVVYQSISKKKMESDRAAQYGMSVGKYHYVQELCNKYDLNMDEVAGENVHELYNTAKRCEDNEQPETEDECSDDNETEATDEKTDEETIDNEETEASDKTEETKKKTSKNVKENTKKKNTEKDTEEKRSEAVTEKNTTTSTQEKTTDKASEEISTEKENDSSEQVTEKNSEMTTEDSENTSDETTEQRTGDFTENVTDDTTENTSEDTVEQVRKRHRRKRKLKDPEKGTVEKGIDISEETDTTETVDIIYEEGIGTGNTESGIGNTESSTGNTESGTGNTGIGTGNTESGTGGTRFGNENTTGQRDTDFSTEKQSFDHDTLEESCEEALME